MKNAEGERVSPSTALLIGASFADRSRHFFASSRTASVMTWTSPAMSGFLSRPAEDRERFDFELARAGRPQQAQIGLDFGDARAFELCAEDAVRAGNLPNPSRDKPFAALEAVEPIVVVGQDAPDLAQPQRFVVGV